MESILGTIKKLLGSPDEDVSFDADIIFHINTALSILTQEGIGPKNGFRIYDESFTWSDFIGDDPRLETVKSYVYFKVKLMFDPPTNTTVLNAMQQMCSEMEWRLYESQRCIEMDC